MKEVVIVLAHCDTDEKISLLEETISVSKSQGFDVIVSTHIQVPDNIYNISDYVIYDKENPIITQDEYLKFGMYLHYFINYPDIRIKYNFSINHGYAVLKLIKNAISLAITNGYDISHIINYDYIIYDNSVFEKHLSLLDEYDVVSYNWGNNIICSAFFSTKNEPLNKILFDIKSKEDYCSVNLGILEEFLYHMYSSNNYKIHLEDIDLIRENNGIDKITVNNGLRKHIIRKNVELEDPKFQIFLCKEDNVFYLLILSNDTVELFINDKNIDFVRSYTNVFRIKEETLKEGLNISIPDYNHSDVFNLSTRTAECNILNKDCVIELF